MTRPSATLRSRNAGNHELSVRRYRLVAFAQTGDSDEATTASSDRGECIVAASVGSPAFAEARDTAASTIRFGTTPVFLDDQDGFLARWSAYLSPAVGTPVQFVHRRSYRDIMGLLRSQEIEAAWICGFPWVVNKQDLRGLSIPLYEGAPIYRSYLIVPASDVLTKSHADLAGKVFAYSDPDSNSGFLVPRTTMMRAGINPDHHFSRTFFTWGHNERRARGRGRPGQRRALGGGGGICDEERARGARASSHSHEPSTEPPLARPSPTTRTTFIVSPGEERPREMMVGVDAGSRDGRARDQESGVRVGIGVREHLAGEVRMALGEDVGGGNDQVGAISGGAFVQRNRESAQVLLVDHPREAANPCGFELPGAQQSHDVAVTAPVHEQHPRADGRREVRGPARRNPSWSSRKTGVVPNRIVLAAESLRLGERGTSNACSNDAIGPVRRSCRRFIAVSRFGECYESVTANG